jgi:glycosyltransferase involved in cell wall biosynthesis
MSTTRPVRGSEAEPPTVSVVTPFYNTAEYLAECIESVLAQTNGDFEYVLADNASTDGSREIAESYAARDPRIRFYTFEEHLPQLANYNRALGLIDAGSTYCKVAQADDLLMPRCLEEMVGLAETDPWIGMVVGYTVLQDHVFLDGMDFRESVLEGPEVGARYLRGGPWLFGSPTNGMYRASLVRAEPEFYPTEARTGDAHAALRILIEHRFGFVHQVLSVTRRRGGSISDQWGRMGIDVLTRRVLLERYGAHFLQPEDRVRERKRLERRHYRVLGEAMLLRRPAAYWDLHRGELATVGLGIERLKVALWAVAVVGRMLLNAEWFFRPGWPWNR